MRKMNQVDIQDWFKKHEKTLKTFDINLDGQVSFHEKRWAANLAVKWAEHSLTESPDENWYYYREKKVKGPVSWQELSEQQKMNRYLYIRYGESKYWLPYRIVELLNKRGYEISDKRKGELPSDLALPEPPRRIRFRSVDDELAAWFEDKSRVLNTFDVNQDRQISFQEKLWATRVADRWARRAQADRNEKCWLYYRDGDSCGPVAWSQLRHYEKKGQFLFIRLKGSPYWLPYKAVSLLKRKKKYDKVEKPAPKMPPPQRKIKPPTHHLTLKEQIADWLEDHARALGTFDINGDRQISFHEKQWAVSTALRWAQRASENQYELCWLYYEDGDAIGYFTWKNLKAKQKDQEYLFIRLKNSTYWLPHRIIEKIMKKI